LRRINPIAARGDGADERRSECETSAMTHRDVDKTTLTSPAFVAGARSAFEAYKSDHCARGN
jgi:hypothetical protein